MGKGERGVQHVRPFSARRRGGLPQAEKLGPPRPPCPRHPAGRARRLLLLLGREILARGRRPLRGHPGGPNPQGQAAHGGDGRPEPARLALVGTAAVPAPPAAPCPPGLAAMTTKDAIDLAKVFLFDLDGSLADYDGAVLADLER